MPKSNHNSLISPSPSFIKILVFAIKTIRLNCPPVKPPSYQYKYILHGNVDIFLETHLSWLKHFYTSIWIKLISDSVCILFGLNRNLVPANLILLIDRLYFNCKLYLFISPFDVHFVPINFRNICYFCFEICHSLIGCSYSYLIGIFENWLGFATIGHSAFVGSCCVNICWTEVGKLARFVRR